MPHDNHAYFLMRERRCREMAAQATDPSVQCIHEEMAERYAESAREQPTLGEMAWQQPTIRDGPRPIMNQA
ncbi:MAG: hypothetical protein H7X93_04650 [Sphingomonadaceae bacterium]|nr:hypothetical protein [Sphingomonadaceae bacterium]